MKSLPRKFWIAIALLAGTGFLFGALVGFGVPKLKTYILLKTESFSQARLPLRILPKSIQFHLFPVAVSFGTLRVAPKEELQSLIDPFEIGEAEVQISLLKLLTGKLKINRLAIRKTKLKLRLPESKKTKSNKPLAGLFAALQSIPLQNLDIEDSDIKIYLPNPKTEISISGLLLNAEKYNDEVGLQVSADSIYLKDLVSKADLRIGTDCKIFLSPDKIIISHFNLVRGDSQFVINGTAQGDIEALQVREYDMKVHGNFNLESMSTWAAKALGKSNQFPKMSGAAELSADFKLRPGQTEEYKFNLKTENLKLRGYYFGSVQAKGSLLNKEVSIPSLLVKNDSYKVELQNLKVSLNDQIRMTATAKVSELSIFELFKNLGLKEIPLWLTASGELPCEAEIKPSFALKCAGSIQGNNLLLRPNLKTDRTIVKLASFSATGSLQVNTEAVSFDAHLSMPNSNGATQGRVSYDDGFHIKYQADKLDFKDVSNLSDLKIEGSSQINGETSGDSSAATMSLQMSGTDFWLSDFWLGSAKTNLSYAKGKLNFSNMSGHYNKSNYQADVVLNLIENQISVMGRSQKLDGADLLQIFGRKVKLPFAVTGTGSLQAKVWGPLQFNALSYDIKSQISRGSIWREPFEQFLFDLHSRDGEVETDRVQLVRGGQIINLSGVGHPDGNINVSAHAQNIKLEESPNFEDFGLSITSLAEFDLKLEGYVLKPDADLFGKLSKTSVADQPAGDSDFHIKFRENTIETQGHFLSDTVLTDLIIPLNANAPFALKLKTKEWNFAPLFASLKAVSAKRDFDSRLTSEVNLTAPNGGIWNSSGKIGVQKFELKRGALSMFAPKDVKIKVNEGQFRIENFNLAGQNTSLKISDATPPTDKIDWQINGKLDMSLISLLLPFFEELRGELSFACNIKANPSRVDLLGSAYIDHGFLKLFDFVHPFDEIKADILFNKKKVLINSIKGDFAGGQITGDGNLEFKSYHHLPFQINATLDKVSLKVPDGFLTKGDGKLTLSGTWFPFLLKGSYEVSDGLVSKEFGDNEDSTNAKFNQYLPKNISEENQSPLILDLDVNFNKGLPIRNSLMEGTLKGKMNIKGSPQKASLIGIVSAAPESKVKFNERPFDVITANFTFDDTKEINPKLYLSARTHIDPSTPNSKDIEYDINLLVQGTASKPVVVLTSLPALVQSDIISLLALGTLSTNASLNSNTSQQNGNPGFMLPSSILKQSPIGKGLKDRFDVDLQFTSGFDETENVAVQKISLSGKLADKLGWVYNRSIGSRSDNEISLKYNLSKRFQVVGSFVNRQADETEIQQQKIDNPNVLGLDLEYRFQFK